MELIKLPDSARQHGRKLFRILRQQEPAAAGGQCKGCWSCVAVTVLRNRTGHEPATAPTDLSITLKIGPRNLSVLLNLVTFNQSPTLSVG